MTRYAGLSLIAAGVLGLLLWYGAGVWKSRLGSLALFIGVALLPMAGWLLRNLAVSGTLTNRVPLFHPPGRDALLQGARTISLWVVGPGFPWVVRALGLGILILGLLLAGSPFFRPSMGKFSRGAPQGVERNLARVLALHAVVYVGFLAFSLTFIDASTPLSTRILAPLLKGRERPDYDVKFRAMRQKLRSPNSALVVFHPQALRPGMPSLEVMRQGLVPLYQGSDGLIFEAQ